MSGDFSYVNVLPTEAILDELRRRYVFDNELREILCSFSKPTQVWFVLYVSGPQTFNELLRSGFVNSTLSSCLKKLISVGIVVQQGNKYCALDKPRLKK